MCKGGAPDGRDLRAHEVNLNQSLAVFTGLRANIVKVARKAEALDASSAETAVRPRSRLIGFVRNKIDCRERKAAFDSKGAQLRPGARSLVASVSLPLPTLVSEQHSAKTLRLNRTHPGGHDLLKDIAALESSILKADDRKW